MREVRGLVVVLCVGAGVVLAGCGGRGGAAEHDGPADAARWGGLYVSDTLPAEAGRRVMLLAVGPDTVAAVSLEFVGIGTTYHPGRWSASGDRLTMQPTRGDGTPNEYPFVWRLEGERLVPLDWDRRIYGARGVTLTRQATPAPPADSTAGAKR